jgi:hypothetical protein
MRYHFTLARKARIKKTITSQALVAHSCNPSYSGGRDQEDHSSKPAWANSLRSYRENTHHPKKRAGGVAQGIGLGFKPQYCQKKKKR